LTLVRNVLKAFVLHLSILEFEFYVR